ncbi:efflux RND transporter permease subunit [Thiohalocapsa halophila]
MAATNAQPPDAQEGQQGSPRGGGSGPGNGLGPAGHIARWCIDSPLTPLLLIATLAVGMLGLWTTPRQEDPDISVPMVDVRVQWPGGDAQQVASQAIEPLARILGELADVKHLYAQSRRGGGLVTVRFRVGTDMAKAVVRVRDKIRAHTQLIPPGVTDWRARAKGIDDVPVFAVTLWSRHRDDAALRTLAFDLLQRLQAVPETAAGYIVGGRPRQITIEPQPEQLEGFDITLTQLAETIRGANAEQPSGAVERAGERLTVSAGAQLDSAEDVRRLVVGHRGGTPVYVADVARVTDGPAEPEQALLHYPGAAAGEDRTAEPPAPAVTLAIAKDPGANGVAVTRALRERLATLQDQVIPASVQVEITRDYGESANAKVNELLSSLLGATAAVSVLTLLAVGLRPALVVLAVIPVVILLTVWAAGMLGFTINRVSLFALIFSIGILVDDATVVAENIFRRWLAAGETSAATAVDAVREVGNPTILATLTVLAALLPMGFVTGMMGPYMRPIPVLGSVAMGFSLLAAFVFTPWLAYRLRPRVKSLERAARRERRVQALLARAYRPLLLPLLERRAVAWGFLAAIVAAFLGSLALLPLQAVSVKMLPYDNKREIDVIIDLPEGTALAETANAAHGMAQAVRALPEVRSVQAHIGTAAPVDFNGLVRHYDLRDAPWQADLQIRLLDKDRRERSSHALAAAIREHLRPLAQDADAHMAVVEMPPGPPVRQTLVAVVYGPDSAARRALTQQLTGFFEQADGVVDVDNSLRAPHERWHFRVDTEQASRYGVPVSRVTQTLAMAMGGHRLGAVEQGTDQEPVHLVLQLPLGERSQIARLGNLPVAAGDGSVPLAALGDFQRERQPEVIQHKDLRAVEYVTAGMSGRLGAPIYGMLQIEGMLDDAELPGGTLTAPPDPAAGSGFEWAGEWTVTYETFRDLGLAFIAALALIYVLLVAEFRNFVHPAVIMAPIPLTLIGILPGHWLLGAEFTATSMIGFIALAGIEVRNSILLVDFAQQAVLRGANVKDALVEAGQTRLRPVWVTDLTMMAGAVAILFDPVFQGMAVSLLFGPIIAVPLTLLVVPLGCLSTAGAFARPQGHSAPAAGSA